MDKKDDQPCEHGQRDSFIDLARGLPLLRSHGSPIQNGGARPDVLSH